MHDHGGCADGPRRPCRYMIKVDAQTQIYNHGGRAGPDAGVHIEAHVGVHAKTHADVHAEAHVGDVADIHAGAVTDVYDGAVAVAGIRAGAHADVPIPQCPTGLPLCYPCVTPLLGPFDLAYCPLPFLLLQLVCLVA
jgi:hypothetical protein